MGINTIGDIVLIISESNVCTHAETFGNVIVDTGFYRITLKIGIDKCSLLVCVGERGVIA